MVKVSIQRNAVTLEQTWFLLNNESSSLDIEEENPKWYIPFTYTTKFLNQFDFESRVTWLTPQVNSGKYKNGFDVGLFKKYLTF